LSFARAEMIDEMSPAP